MCKELCEVSPHGEMQSCQDCGRLICFDIANGDDIVRPAYVTEAGDLFCDQCGKEHDRAEEEDAYDPVEEAMALEDLPEAHMEFEDGSGLPPVGGDCEEPEPPY